MANILTQEHKLQLSKKYHYRMGIVICWMLILHVITALILLIPSYIMSGSVEKTLKGRLESSSVSSAGKEIERVTKMSHQTEEQIAYLEKEFSGRSMMSINAILDERTTKGISVSSVQVDRLTGDVTLSGRAETRSDLISYVDSLKTGDIFSNIELPISNLADNKDIDFKLDFNVKEYVPAVIKEETSTSTES